MREDGLDSGVDDLGRDRLVQQEIAGEERTHELGEVQTGFGIGPSCGSPAGNAVPPVRVHQVIEAVSGPGNERSICDSDYTDSIDRPSLPTSTAAPMLTPRRVQSSRT